MSDALAEKKRRSGDLKQPFVNCRTSPITLKISVIEPSGRLYGSEYCLLDIIDGLGQVDIDWSVILPKGQGFDQLLLQRGVRCEFLMPATLSDMSKLRRSAVYGRILRKLYFQKPDILYVNQTGSLRAAAVYSRLLKLPMVCQVQTLEDARWLSTVPKLHAGVKAFICNSEYIAAHTDVASETKCVLYQGLPEHRLDNTVRNNREVRTASSSSVFRIGILGRIAVSKGHYVLLEAAKRLVASLPTCQFKVIGDGLTKQDTDDYKKAVEAAGLTAHFELRGYRTDIQSELSNIDVLAIPSIAEPLGRVLFDAAEFGVPVVVSDAGGLGELSKRFGIGVSFESEDPSGLADAILQTKNDYESMAATFHSAATSMFEQLPLQSYLTAVRTILSNTAEHKTSNVVWLGDS